MGEGGTVAEMRWGDLEADHHILRELYGTYVSARRSSTGSCVVEADVPDIAEFSFLFDPSLIHG